MFHLLRAFASFKNGGVQCRATAQHRCAVRSIYCTFQQCTFETVHLVIAAPSHSQLEV